MSPTWGKLTLLQVREKVLSFIKGNPENTYRIVIGSDSQPSNGKGVDFITALIIHRRGAGGIYFWRRIVDNKKYARKERIFTEATLSLAFADELLQLFGSDGISRYDMEIHVDIGKVGETRDMIAEIVGMVRGSGFTVKIKPDSFGASKVADRHT